MGKQITPEDVVRLMEMVGDVSGKLDCTIPEAIDLVGKMLGQLETRAVERPSVARFAANTLKLRHSRSAELGVPIFRDPSWDMLLDLIVQEEAGRVISVSSLCLASGVAPTTALRHIDRLAHHGLLVRHGDDEDARRTLITLSDKASQRMRSLLSAWVATYPNRPLSSAPPAREPQKN